MVKTAPPAPIVHVPACESCVMEASPSVSIVSVVAAFANVDESKRTIKNNGACIGVGLVVFVIAVIVAQSVMFSFLISRSNAALQGPSPNSFATIVEGDLGSAIAADPTLDLRAHLVREYGGSSFHVCAVMIDQR